jgi:hypothetical protein
MTPPSLRSLQQLQLPPSANAFAGSTAIPPLPFPESVVPPSDSLSALFSDDEAYLLELWQQREVEERRNLTVENALTTVLNPLDDHDPLCLAS